MTAAATNPMIGILNAGMTSSCLTAPADSLANVPANEISVTCAQHVDGCWSRQRLGLRRTSRKREFANLARLRTIFAQNQSPLGNRRLRLREQPPQTGKARDGGRAADTLERGPQHGLVR